MKRLTVLSITIASIALLFACSGQPAGENADSPTGAYKNLYAAVKAKDQETIKSYLTKRTLGLAELQSKRSGTPIERVLENGFTETTFSATLPTIRDERVSEDMGAIEVWNSQKSVWEDLPFIREDGRWKLAVGDIFSGGFKSPGKGRSQAEQEAANALMPQTQPSGLPVNANSAPRPANPSR